MNTVYGGTTVRAKTLYRVIDERAGERRPPLLSVSIHKGVIRRDSVTDDLPRAEDLSGYKLCNKGDIVLNRMRAFQGAIGVSEERGLVSPDYLVLRPHPSADPRYLHHLFRSTWFIGEMTSRLRGIGSTEQGNVRTPRINPDDFGEIYIDLPKLGEQRRIADFLDAEVSRIDRMGAARNRQAELLADRALVEAFEAVSGARYGKPRRDSGVGWLGDIPAEWRSAAVAHKYEVRLGKMLSPSRTQGSHLRPYLRNTNVQWDRISCDDLLLMDFPPDEKTRYEVRPGDLLVCEGGEPGRAAIWDGSVPEIYYQKALHRVRPIADASVRWLFYCLRVAAYRNAFAVEGNTTTISHLTGEQLLRHRFPFPDRPTQDRIVARLDESRHERERLDAVLKAQLEILAERKQALIAAAVTGQIDVSTARGVEVP